MVKEKSPIPAPRKEYRNTLLVRYSAAARCVKFSGVGVVGQFLVKALTALLLTKAIGFTSMGRRDSHAVLR